MVDGAIQDTHGPFGSHISIKEASLSLELPKPIIWGPEDFFLNDILETC